MKLPIDTPGPNKLNTISRIHQETADALKRVTLVSTPEGRTDLLELYFASINIVLHNVE